MPKVFEQSGFRFHFFSNEGDPREPVHVHVTKDGIDAKLWLDPEIAIAFNKGYDARTLRWIAGVVAERRQEIEDAWNEFFP